MKIIKESLISNLIDDSESVLIDDLKIDINTTDEITITRANDESTEQVYSVMAGVSTKNSKTLDRIFVLILIGIDF